MFLFLNFFLFDFDSKCFRPLELKGVTFVVDCVKCVPIPVKIQDDTLLWVTALKHISNLLVIKRKSSYNIRSNSGILLEPPRGKMLTTLGERAFQAAAPHL